MKLDIRWHQRLENFIRAYTQLELALKITNPSVVERAGIIQFYEMTFELSWKTLKDYLTEEGYEVNSPRQALKKAFQVEIISNGHLWIAALEDRNLTVHTYDENKAVQVEKSIREQYFPLLSALVTMFQGLK